MTPAREHPARRKTPPLDTADERVPPARWRDVRQVLAWTLALVLAANTAAFAFLSRYSPNRTPRVTRLKWELIDRAAGGEWLILGDSSGLRGVVPSLFGAQVGGRALNLSTTRRMLAVADAWMLDEYIRLHGPPAGVVLVHVWEVWHGGRDWFVSAMPDIPRRWGFWNAMNPPVPLTPSERTAVFLNRYVPLYADNQSLAQTIRHPRKIGRYAVTGVDGTGYMPIKSANPRQVDDDLLRTVSSVQGQTFEVSELNRRALEHIRELAERHGFDVYLANSPLYDGLYRQPVFQAFFQQVRDGLRAFAATSPRLHYIAQEPWTFPKDQMENCDHVTVAASPVYTRNLAEEIVRIRRGGLQSAPPGEPGT